MKRIKHIGKIMILALLSLLLVCSFPSSSQHSLASTNPTEGFTIEAEEITGTLGIPLIVLGETSSRKAVPMIDLAMDNVEVKGLVIKKITQTPNGTITSVIKSKGTAKLKKMRVRITNLEFGGIFIPKLGYLGMKNVKLLAHKQTADIADLPSFSFSFESGAGSQMESKSEEELKNIIKDLQKGTTVEEEETNEPEEQDKEETNKEDESDKPSGDQPATKPEQPEAETPATDPAPDPSEPTEPEEDGNPADDKEEPEPPADDETGEAEPPTTPPGS